MMATASVRVGAKYRYKGGDVLVDRKSPVPSGGYYIGWKTVDDGPPSIGEAGEPIFCERAVALVGPDEVV